MFRMKEGHVSVWGISVATLSADSLLCSCNLNKTFLTPDLALWQRKGPTASFQFHLNALLDDAIFYLKWVMGDALKELFFRKAH